MDVKRTWKAATFEVVELWGQSQIRPWKTDYINEGLEGMPVVVRKMMDARPTTDAEAIVKGLEKVSVCILNPCICHRTNVGTFH